MSRKTALRNVAIRLPPKKKNKEGTLVTQKILKNIDLSSPLELGSLVSYQTGQIVSRTLAQNKAVSLTLFAFDTGEEISSHESKGDAMVQVLDGTAKITVGGGEYRLARGQTIVMPAGVPHALEAIEPFKMLLTVVFPG
jgi:quercetin dioxygenase-like cupin family protein